MSCLTLTPIRRTTSSQFRLSVSVFSITIEEEGLPKSYLGLLEGYLEIYRFCGSIDLTEDFSDLAPPLIQ